MLITLQQEGPRYHPDIVILGYVWFDKYRNLRRFNDYAKPRFERVGNDLVETGVPVPSPDEVLAREPYRSKAVDLFVMLCEKIRWTFGMNRREADDLTRPILDEMAAAAHNLNAVL